ncbi:methyl-accepting chemotaxis protein [Pseudooceanicola sp. MF1-13]|uniref:methyl-accepting chemotaxis protein n=1 Tax=Pseudooceanicola sp. MF1-13 TaxID=3379095 RepID=UPI003892A773
MHHEPTGIRGTRLTDDSAALNRVAQNASTLGGEIVDVAGFLDQLEAQTGDQMRALRQLREGAGQVVQMNASSMETLASMSEKISSTLEKLQHANGLMLDAGEQTGAMIGWINSIDERSHAVQGTLDAVQTSNNQIADIAQQVNMLAINAKIEAVRAGDTGKGFAVVADAINELSHRTGKAAEDISDNITALIDWISTLQQESGTMNARAGQMQDISGRSRDALDTALADMQASHQRTGMISHDAAQADAALKDFLPNIAALDASVKDGVTGVLEAHSRVSKLVDTSEKMVQDSVSLGGNHGDALFIEAVQDRAKQVSDMFEKALQDKRISLADLFDSNYRTVVNTNPTQVTTRFTRLTDMVLPAIQEPVLDLDRRVAFCAAVDRNGYLPTHNRKFSHPQSDDPVWNTANCRNRRIFNDRVGLKAGRNTAPFLLQVYRRDMGGGSFVLMKDVSAPIIVQGRHWGGMRLAYTF